MRNNWSRTNRMEQIRPTIAENINSRYNSSGSIVEEESEYNSTERTINNIPQLAISSQFSENQVLEGVKQLTSEQLASLKVSFEKFSSTKTLKKPNRSRLNANGVRQIMTSQPEIDITLSEKQLNQLFIDASIPLHKQTLNQIYSSLCKSKSVKGISFSDLLELMNLSYGLQQNNDDYEQIFKAYDRKKRGYFDYEDYKYVCEGIAKELTEGQMREAFDIMDKERSNQITFSKFKLVMKGIH